MVNQEGEGAEEVNGFSTSNLFVLLVESALDIAQGKYLSVARRVLKAIITTVVRDVWNSLPPSSRDSLIADSGIDSNADELDESEGILLVEDHLTRCALSLFQTELKNGLDELLLQFAQEVANSELQRSADSVGDGAQSAKFINNAESSIRDKLEPSLTIFAKVAINRCIEDSLGSGVGIPITRSEEDLLNAFIAGECDKSCRVEAFMRAEQCFRRNFGYFDNLAREEYQEDLETDDVEGEVDVIKVGDLVDGFVQQRLDQLITFIDDETAYDMGPPGSWPRTRNEIFGPSGESGSQCPNGGNDEELCQLDVTGALQEWICEHLGFVEQDILNARIARTRNGDIEGEISVGIQRLNEEISRALDHFQIAFVVEQLQFKSIYEEGREKLRLTLAQYLGLVIASADEFHAIVDREIEAQIIETRQRISLVDPGSLVDEFGRPIDPSEFDENPFPPQEEQDNIRSELLFIRDRIDSARCLSPLDDESLEDRDSPSLDEFLLQIEAHINKRLPHDLRDLLESVYLEVRRKWELKCQTFDRFILDRDLFEAQVQILDLHLRVVLLEPFSEEISLYAWFRIKAQNVWNEIYLKLQERFGEIVTQDELDAMLEPIDTAQDEMHSAATTVEMFMNETNSYLSSIQDCESAKVADQNANDAWATLNSTHPEIANDNSSSSPIEAKMEQFTLEICCRCGQEDLLFEELQCRQMQHLCDGSQSSSISNPNQNGLGALDPSTGSEQEETGGEINDVSMIPPVISTLRTNRRRRILNSLTSR